MALNWTADDVRLVFLLPHFSWTMCNIMSVAFLNLTKSCLCVVWTMPYKYLFYRRHTVSPLTALRRRKDPTALGERNADALPLSGQVHELTRHFAAIQSPPASTQHRNSSTSPRRSRGSGRKSAHVPIIVGQDIHPVLSDTNEQKRRSVTRPRSWDSTPVWLMWY